MKNQIIKKKGWEQSLKICLVCVLSISGIKGLSCALEVDNLQRLYVCMLMKNKHSS